MVIQHCMEAMNANRMLNVNVKDQAKASEKLSSGYRINRAADDAAGLSISEKMRRQVRGLTQAAENAQDGISLVQIAEGALNEVHDMLQRMNELCVKSANDTLTYEDKTYIQSEIEALQTEIDRTGGVTTFNEIKILNGIRQEMVRATAPALGYNGIGGGTLTQATSNALASYTIRPLSDGTILTTGDGSEKTYYSVNGPNPPAHQVIYDDDGNIIDEIIPGSSRYPYSISKESVYRDIASRLSKANTTDDHTVSITYQIAGPDEGKFNMEFFGKLQLKLQVGSEAGQTMDIKISPVNASSLGLWNVNVATRDNSGPLAGIETVKNALQKVSQERSNLGAYQNRLEHTIRNLDNVVENTTGAESRIRDTDMAHQMVNYSNRNILIQAGQTILSQANQTNQGVLSLLQ